MAVFSYTAINEYGEEISGLIEADDSARASADIASRGLYVVKVSRAAMALESLRKRFLHRRIKRKPIIEFAKNLSLMMKAGVPIISGLQDIAETAEQKSFKEVIAAIAKSVEMGISFSEAVAAHSFVLPDIFVRLVAIGEETGSLEKSLQDVADHLQRVDDLVAALQRALIYPVFALLATGGALIFWMAFVLPQLKDAFTGMGVELPALTVLLMESSTFVQGNLGLGALALIALCLAVPVFKKVGAARYYIDLLMIRLPLLRLIVHNKLIALFAEQLRILLVAGITVDRALEVIADVIGNEVFRRAVLDALERIKAGNLVADSLKKHNVFPPMVLRMISIGETSGSLDVQLAYLSEYYLKLLDDTADKFGKMLEPIMIIVIGLIFLCIIAGILLPIYDLIKDIG